MAMEHEAISAPVLFPPMQGGIELYWAESRYRTTNWANAPADEAEGDDAADVFVGLTVLLNFSTDARDREAMAALRNALAFADCTTALFDGADWPQRLAERLVTVRPDFVTVAIYVGTTDRVVAETVQRAVDALKQAFGSHMAAIVLVSDTASRWSAVRGISGCIQGCHATTGDTARLTFLVLAMLTAPNTLNGIDFTDLAPSLGSSSAPSVLAEAVWLRDGEHQLVPVGMLDARVMVSAKRLVATALVHDFTWAELGRLTSELSAQRLDADTSIVFAPQKALRAGLSTSAIGHVLCLCSGI